MRYGQIGVDHWPDLSGEAIARGLGDIRKWPLSDYCAFVWWWATNGRDQRDVEKFRNRLWQPPKGTPIPKQSPWSAENEAKSFQSLKSALAPSKTPK